MFIMASYRKNWPMDLHFTEFAEIASTTHNPAMTVRVEAMYYMW